MQSYWARSQLFSADDPNCSGYLWCGWLPNKVQVTAKKSNIPIDTLKNVIKRRKKGDLIVLQGVI